MKKIMFFILIITFLLACTRTKLVVTSTPTEKDGSIKNSSDKVETLIIEPEKKEPDFTIEELKSKDNDNSIEVHGRIEINQRILE